MGQKFSDHFAPVAANYADFRPSYPHELFNWLASLLRDHALAWDCATGSGQAAVDLSTYFERVVATDASQSQIDTALPHPGIEYRVTPAEASGLPDNSVDLITVAQALHWFDLDGFYAEAKRVLKSSGAVAVWTYGVLSVEGAPVNALVQHFYHETVGPYWPAERIHVETGYRSLPFPFNEIATPQFSMEELWILPQLLGYFRSWSATGRFIASNGFDPVDVLAQQLVPVWGDPQTKRLVTWPLSLRIGQGSQIAKSDAS